MVTRIAANSSPLECKSDSVELFAGLQQGQRTPGANATDERASEADASMSAGDARGPEGLGIAILLVFQGAIFFAIGFFVARWTH